MVQLDPEDKEKINRKVQALADKTVGDLKIEQGQVGIGTYSGGSKKIKATTKEKDGLVKSITFKFPRYLVFVEKGASRGHGGNKGSRWENKKGEEIRTNPASLGKANSGNRKAKEWFNPPIEKFVQELTNEVAQEFVNLAFKNIRIK